MKRGVIALLALCLLTASAFAQSSAGRLVGTVSSTDGVIAGATVTVIDNQTGRERTLVTNEEGAFALTSVEVGTYTVKITAPGFKTFTATNVKIDVGREYALNSTLEAGDIKEEVTVVAGADVLNSTTAELSNTVSSRQITELPLNGRNPLALITLQAGTSSNGATNTAINGQRTSFTNITRDGINVNDNFIRANATDFSPERASSDDTGEFNVITQNAGADSGYGA
ncbi:MAG TPA: carboxypeptidase-like regulatory domain-containing protein, partial [Pyrinomonadaceae bacterium]